MSLVRCARYSSQALPGILSFASPASLSDAHTAVPTSATSATTEPTIPASTSYISRTLKVCPCLPHSLLLSPHRVHSKVFQWLRILQGLLLSSPPVPSVLTPFHYSGLAQTRNSPCTTITAGPGAAVLLTRASTVSYSPQTGPQSASYTAYPCLQR